MNKSILFNMKNIVKYLKIALAATFYDFINEAFAKRERQSKRPGKEMVRKRRGNKTNSPPE